MQVMMQVGFYGHVRQYKNIQSEIDANVKRVLVQHNQNATLRPNDKMLRGACLNCHGLAFSLDALADAALVERNFAGRPAVHVKSVEMALEAERRADESRRKAKEAGS